MIGRAMLQAIFAFGLLFAVIRLQGKMEIAQGTFWSFASAVTLGSLGTWGFLTFAISYVTLKHRGARGLLDGKPTVVIHNGKILEEQMRAERYDLDKLMADLRSKQVSSLAQTAR